jgi:hypothetical protein
VQAPPSTITSPAPRSFASKIAWTLFTFVGDEDPARQRRQGAQIDLRQPADVVDPDQAGQAGRIDREVDGRESAAGRADAVALGIAGRVATNAAPSSA